MPATRPGDAYEVRTMQPAEVALAVDWAAGEGWNPGLQDADSFLAADADGFWIGLHGGRPASCLSAVRYGAGFGFIGFYIVHPDYRGRGYGLRLWQAALDALGGARTLGLDGVVERQHDYRRSGFELAHRNIRFGGIAAPRPRAGTPRDIVPLSAVALGDVLAYDRPCFPAPREDFLRAWLAQPGMIGRAWMPGGSLAGYGVARPCRQGWKIGPLFADTPAGADALAHALVDALPPGSPYWLDVPAPNAHALALADRLQLVQSFETARMYRGAAPDLPLDRIYGITSFELG
ncbi:Acetyltransferase (GNAT) family protein [Pigmentiphaga humi]|uniref:Acetyltransferase (GNAT) family protein n=1 Tax=Pigmentiphaga humi TaxID=2478468 RepID=A0A3P4AZN9_9BURK|nr:GNAT family N-acetyltransferase [Pigmentiphaga humi]VCU69529.1 Acetyltransferase (GNAT) family protein [Pigmentiphaga humi]